MNKKQFINLFACFLDAFSIDELSKHKEESELGKRLYEEARSAHYALQAFIRDYEMLTPVDDNYYDFFFENMVKELNDSTKIMEKYGISELEVNLKKGEK